MSTNDPSRRADHHPRGLTTESFEALLQRLGPDRDRAGLAYEEIRHRLVRLFEWRGCANGEELADETINRVARRLAEGVEVGPHRELSYFVGVAHLVYSEVVRREARRKSALARQPAPPCTGDPIEENPRLDCLHRCLETLSPQQRHLVLSYHAVDASTASRQALGRELGLAVNALRIRVHRLCRKLESCVERCLETARGTTTAARPVRGPGWTR
jgi:DNA-directed RNA polymerase specialized sigma24 family protein